MSPKVYRQIYTHQIKEEAGQHILGEHTAFLRMK